MGNERRGRLRGLYAITPECGDTARLVSLVERALEGGAALVQYRAKDADASLAMAQARALLAACRRFGRPLIVNDSLELAVSVGADGVHLGRDDADPARARRLMPHLIVGVSCYDDPARAREARAAGADYVAVGSMFASPTKPAARRASLGAIAEAASASGLPVAAIGGITLDNAPGVVAAGADMLAVISAVFDASDVAAASRSFAAFYGGHSRGNSDVRTQPRAL